MENEKIVKNSKVFDKVFNVFEKLLLVAAIVLAVLIVIVPIFGDALITKPNVISIGNVVVVLKNADIIRIASSKLVLEMILVPGLICALISWYGVRMFRKVLAPMKEGRPFDKSAADNIKKFGAYVIIGGVITNVCSLFSNVFEVMLYDVEKVFNMNVVSKITYDYKFDFSFVVIALLIFLLAHVFRYGEALQVESDETL